MPGFKVEVQRENTATGFEWFLTVDGKRVQTNEHRVGIFTDQTWQPHQMLPRLLALAATSEGQG